MDLYDWLLFLHVVAAFVTVAAVVVLGALVLGARGEGSTPLLRLAPLAGILWNVGGIAVLVLGILLALDLDAYSILDGWIIGAIVLWFIASAAGGTLTAAYRPANAAPTVTAPARAIPLFAVMALATTAMLVVMIYKPGA